MDPSRIQNVLAVEAGFVERDDRAWGGPREAWIEVAARCNLRCVMCPITYDPRYRDGSMPEFLTPDRFSALEPIFATLERAHLFGLGEPMLSPHLFDYASRLTAAGVEVWTTTNATLIGPTEAEAFADAGFRRVSVSIDGATPDTYERIRRHGRFADVVAGIRALGEVRRRRGSPRLYLAMVAMASNLHEVPALVDLAADMGADGVHIGSLYAWDHPSIEELARTEGLLTLGEGAVAAALAEGERRARAHGIEFWSEVFLGSGSSTECATAPTAAIGLRSPCSEPWSTINVNARGQIRTCCFNDEAMGTLEKGVGISEIWNGATYRDLRSHHLRLQTPPSCARCVHAGRAKRSPYLPAETGRTSESNQLPAVLAPANGEVCDERVVVVGALPKVGWRQRVLRVLEAAPIPGRCRTWAGRRIEPLSLPDLYLDGELVARVADSGVIDDSLWAIVVEAPFVSPGSHRLSVRGSGSQSGELWTERRLRFVENAGADRLVATTTLPIWLELDRPEPSPTISIAGDERRLLTWLCGGYGNAWRGFALLDVADLAPGSYAAEIALPSHPPRRIRFRRIVVDRPPSQTE